MIAILGAMEIEMNAVLQYVNIKKQIDNNGFTIYEGQMNGKEVVLCLSGVGGNKASMTMTQVLERYKVDCVINIGTAGGLKEYENVLDVVISSRVLKHDFDTEGVYDLALGFHDENPLIKFADEKLQQLASQIMENFTGSATYIGDVVSGDKFIYKDEDVNYIVNSFSTALCADMESASIADVCDFYKVPFIIIRSLSDIAVKEGNELQFGEYVEKASVRSADFVRMLVDEIKA